jgi:ABC-type bacteriocin/lantibiotic exporter with double-glycine peptidase domain
MKVEIEISDDKTANLSKSAQDELAKVTKGYVEEVLDEAGRLEAIRNATPGQPEITASIISDAVVFTKKYKIGKRKSGWTLFIQILASVSSLFAGGLWDTSEFNKNTGNLLLFLFVLIVAVVTSVYLIVKGNGND